MTKLIQDTHIRLKMIIQDLITILDSEKHNNKLKYFKITKHDNLTQELITHNFVYIQNQ